jgi:uncharacterized protein YbjT (DUF2867 family)
MYTCIIGARIYSYICTMRTALVAGASGLTGKQCVYLLLEAKEYMKVIALVRVPLKITHRKLLQVVVDYDNLEAYRQQLTADDVFCCLGTTIKVARTRENFKKVDLEYPVKLGRITLQNGAAQFLLVSAMGADIHSRIFYSRVKGETEAAVTALGFPSLSIFRPSMLTGERKEQRFGESIGKWLTRIFRFLIPSQYRSIEGVVVARAMVRTALKNVPGTRILRSDEISIAGK